MKPDFKNYYFEARSNPEQNPKLDVDQAIMAAYESLGQKSKSKVGLSMTHVDKLGVNPRSTYDTPLGIYAYPFDWVYNEAKAKKPTRGFKDILPFEGNAPYANVFDWKDSAVMLDLASFDQSQYEYFTKKLVDVIAKLDPVTRNPQLVVDKWKEDAPNMARVDTPGGRFWYVTMKAASHILEGKEYEFDSYDGDYEGEWEALDPLDFSDSSADHWTLATMWNKAFPKGKPKEASEFKNLSPNQKRQLLKKLGKILGADGTKWKDKPTAKGHPVIWNKIFRELGIDGVIDDGDGIVHNNEPHQMVIFNPRVIDKVVRVENVSRSVAKQFSAKGKEYYERIINLLLQGRLTKDIVKQIMSKINLDFNNGGNLSVDEEELLTKRYHFLNTALHEALNRAAIDAYQNVRAIEPVRRVISGYTKNFGDINSDIAKSVLNKYSMVYTFPLLKYVDLSDAEGAKILWSKLTGIANDIGFSKQEKLNAMNEILGYRNVSSVGVERDERFKTLIDYVQDLEK